MKNSPLPLGYLKVSCQHNFCSLQIFLYFFSKNKDIFLHIHSNLKNQGICINFYHQMY